MKKEIRQLRKEIDLLIEDLKAEGREPVAAAIRSLIDGEGTLLHPYDIRSEAAQELVTLGDHLEGEGNDFAVEALIDLMETLVEEQAGFVLVEVF